MRISDWSSDVCSYDLRARGIGAGVARRHFRQRAFGGVDLLLAVLRQAQLEQRTGRLVMGGIAVEDGLELLLRQRVVLGDVVALAEPVVRVGRIDRKSTRLNSSH